MNSWSNTACAVKPGAGLPTRGTEDACEYKATETRVRCWSRADHPPTDCDSYILNSVSAGEMCSSKHLMARMHQGLTALHAVLIIARDDCCARTPMRLPLNALREMIRPATGLARG